MSTININSVTGIPYFMNSGSNSTTNGITANPTIIIVGIVVIICYYALFASLGTTSSTSISAASSPNEFFFIEILLWSVFIILILLNGMSYFFNFDITAGIKNIFSGEPVIDIVVENETDDADSSNGGIAPSNAVPEITKSKQVFHIPGNNYTYEDSKALCSAYGGQLATYKEMDEAYTKGSDWCSYGWSDKQMALFPTQYEKWDKLQKIEGHENDCGRPGINGGYIANPSVRFGVNCYGYKPEMNSEESKMMTTTSIYPKTAKEIAFDKNVDYWKGKISEIIVAPFNNTNWSIV